MRKIIFITLLFCSTLLAQGFKSYDVVIVSSIDSLTLQQAKSVVDAYAKGKSITKVQHTLFIKRGLVKTLYRKILAIESMATHLMRNYSIETIEELKLQVGTKHKRANYVIDKMVAYSKRDGSGDWDYYSTEVIK